MKSDGNEKNITDEETLTAARVNLATFGVMVEIKMAVVTTPCATVDTIFPLVGECFTTTFMENLYSTNWSLELFWYPYNSIPLWSMLPRKGNVFTQNWNPDEDEIFIRKMCVYTGVGMGGGGGGGGGGTLILPCKKVLHGYITKIQYIHFHD